MVEELGKLKKDGAKALPPGLGPGGPKLKGGLAGLKLGGMGPSCLKKKDEGKKEGEQKNAQKPPKPRPSTDQQPKIIIEEKKVEEPQPTQDEPPNPTVEELPKPKIEEPKIEEQPKPIVEEIKEEVKEEEMKNDNQKLDEIPLVASCKLSLEQQ